MKSEYKLAVWKKYVLEKPEKYMAIVQGKKIFCWALILKLKLGFPGAKEPVSLRLHEAKTLSQLLNFELRQQATAQQQQATNPQPKSA